MLLFLATRMSSSKLYHADIKPGYTLVWLLHPLDGNSDMIMGTNSAVVKLCLV